ncbi:hypothetical protein Bealeia1_01485 [Candidatus Bealeia paramacronuclearis]|uniref:Uncharacterized protein n=1 Tax=Candidatus Bealeia paramacronuclearis TaxID=1921001 RepID=A0ABZ2C5A5_9PROT|nr:hypothetical protein [Candidatus Bealeia paramacronuclearis]
MRILISSLALSVPFFLSQPLDAMFNKKFLKEENITSSKVLNKKKHSWEDIQKSFLPGENDDDICHKIALLVSDENQTVAELETLISNIFKETKFHRVAQTALTNVKHQHSMKTNDNSIVQDYSCSLIHRLRATGFQARVHLSGYESFGWLLANKDEKFEEHHVTLAEQLFSTIIFLPEYDHYQDIIKDTLEEKKKLFSQK